MARKKAKKYSYEFSASEEISDYASPEADGYELKKGGFINAEGNVLPLIETKVEVYATARWTDGKQASVRITIPVSFAAGYEDQISDQIENAAFSYIENLGEGFDRLEEIEITDVEFKERKIIVKVLEYYRRGQLIKAYEKTQATRFTDEQEDWLVEQESMSKDIQNQFNKEFGTNKSLNSLRSKHSRL